MRQGKVPKMTTGQAVLIGLMDRYVKGLLNPFVSLLELHKLMHFMQGAGEPLRLGFTKGPMRKTSGMCCMPLMATASPAMERKEINQIRF